ncbi:MAG: phage tail tape measure protein [Mobiluncus porci]|uniref:phage tail tape measure protein n=1 Tax=Mobiluncus porci TaxID=2652278 RepID=UPI0023F3777E|nr:phage tail tape measure protein [Mobiluncus porci]MDD7541173.1 phage tail tape measure protein [Mobiluncus porci]MDY5748062.1 phage tail tape measure protein [Mobiluncus porci]
MADYTLSVRITGDATQAISAISKTGAAAAALGKQTDALNAVKMGGLSAGMSAAAASIGRAKTAAMSMAEAHGAAMATVGSAATKAGLALGATAALAVKSAADWESAWAGVTKTVDGADLGGVLEGQLREMAKNLPSSHEEIAAVAEAAGQLGVKRKDIAGFTKTMIDLGQSTNLSAEEAATQIARFNNIMGLSNKQASNLGATLVDLGNTNATTEAEIMAMSMRIAAAGRQVKMTAPDILAISASLTSVGIGAEAGGSAMSKFFTKMDQAVSTGNKDLQVMAKTAGMTGEEFSKLFRTDSAQAFAAFEKGLGNLIKSGSGANQVMADMNINQVEMQRALKSLSLDADGLARNLGQGAKAWKENRALIDEATKRYATAESQFAMAKNRIKDGLIDVGKDLAPMIANVVSGLSMLVDGFTNLPGPLKTAAGAFSLFGGAGMLAVGAAASLLPKIIELRKAMTELGAIKAGESILGGLGRRAVASIGGLASGLEAVVFKRSAAKAAAKAEAETLTRYLADGASLATAKLEAATAKNNTFAASSHKASGALKSFGAAAKGAAVAAAPFAGTSAAIVAGALAISTTVGYGAAQLGNFATGIKRINEESINLQSKLAAFDGKDFAKTMFGDVSMWKEHEGGVASFLKAVNAKNEGALASFARGDLWDNGVQNALGRLDNLSKSLARMDIADTVKPVTAALKEMGGVNLDNFTRFANATPEYRQYLTDLAKELHLSADDATLFKLATGEISQVVDATGGAVAKTAAEVETMRNKFGSLPPTSKEMAEAMDKVKQTNYEAAMSFVNIGEAADQGIEKWHAAMMKQGEAVRAWGSNMLEAMGTGILSPVALDSLRAMGTQGAQLLQEAMGEMRAGSDAGLRKLNEGLTMGGQGAARAFSDAFSDGMTQSIMQKAQEKSPEVARAVAQALQDPLITEVSQMQDILDGYGVDLKITGDTEPAEIGAGYLVSYVNSLTGTVSILGTDADARSVLEDLGMSINATTGEVTINGNPAPANATLGDLIGNVNTADGTVTINGNKVPATATVEDFVSWAIGQNPDLKVTADTGEANNALQILTEKERVARIRAELSGAENINRVLNNMARNRTSVITVKTQGGGTAYWPSTMRASGGYITGPGTSTSDSIPAWLSNGEFVMRAAAVRKYGTDFMRRINENRFASGGQVGAVRFGSDPAKWLETNLKPVTDSLKEWAGGLPGINPTPTVGDNNRTKTLLDGRDFDLLQQIAGYLFSIDQNTKNAATRGSDSGGSSYSGGSGLGDSDADARKAEEEARRAEEEKKRQAEAALREYKALMEDVKRYGKQITDAFETLAEIQELMKPVAPEANSKGQITDSARERASEKNASNFERAVEQLQRLQETMGDLFTKYAETWQVKGHERAALDEFGKPVEWNVGGEINKQSSREQVSNLIGFLTQGFQGLLGELNIVKSTMGQKATPLDILKQLKVGEFANTETGSAKATATATQATAQNTGSLIGEVRALRDFVKPQNSDSGAPKMTSLYMAGKTQENALQATTGGDTGLLEKVTKLTDQAAETYRMLAETRITITPEVQILTIDDIQAHARVIVKTKLDYSDLQNQTNVAVSSIKPPPIVVPMVLGSSTM